MKPHIDEQAYEALYRESVEHPEAFWAAQATKFLDWMKPWDRVLDWDYSKGYIRWFEGAELNASFLEQDLIDEVYWTVGANLLGTDALPMIAPIPGESPFADEPRRGRLTSVIRHEDELFLRYRFGSD